jgi:peptide/nickel transport system substrate-binding protein
MFTSRPAAHRFDGARLRVPVAVLGVVTVAALIAGCTQPAAEPEDTELSLRIGSTPGTWDPLDPAYYPASAPSQAVYEPLIMLDAEGQPQPWLAESFEVSDDGLTITLELRDDVDFSDGTHLDAAAVDTYLEAFFASEGASTGAQSPFAADGVTVDAAGEYTLELTSTKPIRGLFYNNLSQVHIGSPVAIEDRAALAETPAGTGPFLLDELVADASISYVANPDYWNRDAFPFDTLELIVFTDDVAALNALQSGQIDAANIDDLSLASGAADDESLELHRGAGGQPTLFFIDREGATVPALADKRVRQAINMAFDREGINDALNFGLGTVSSQPFVPTEAAYVEGGDDRYPYDPDAARELLAEAGYADGFSFTVASIAGVTDGYEPILQQSLADIGIDIVFEQVAAADALTLFFDKWPNEAYPVASYPLVVGLTRFYWVEAFLGGFEDATAQGLYDTYLTGSDEESAAAIAELGEYLLDEAWFAPLSAPPCLIVSRPGLTVNVVETLHGRTPISLWAYIAD